MQRENETTEVKRVNESSSVHPARGSVSNKERSLAPDLARGAMLLFMAMAYAPVYLFDMERGVYTHPAGGDFLDRTIHFFSLIILDSRAYPMFAALFGYGMAVLVSRQLAAGTSQVAVRRLLQRRSLFLLLFGFVHGVLVYPGEILGPYGIAGLLVGWLLFRSQRALLTAATVIAPIFLITVPLLGISITSMDLTGAMVPGYSGAELLERLFSYPVAMITNLLFFPIVPAILLGVWAGRRGLLDQPHEHRMLLRRTAIIGIWISVLGGLPVAIIGAELWQPDSTTVGLLLGLQILTGVFGGFGYVALFGWISIWIGNGRGVLVRALAAAGKHSLTCYLIQSILIAVVLSSSLLGVGGVVHSFGAAMIAILAWLVGVGFAVILERTGKRGPADALLRRLVYRDPQHRSRGNPPSIST